MSNFIGKKISKRLLHNKCDRTKCKVKNKQIKMRSQLIKNLQTQKHPTENLNNYSSIESDTYITIPQNDLNRQLKVSDTYHLIQN